MLNIIDAFPAVWEAVATWMNSCRPPKWAGAGNKAEMTSGLLGTQVSYAEYRWVLPQSAPRARFPSVNWKSYLPIWVLALPSMDCVVLMALGKALCCLLAGIILFDSEESKIYILKHILFDSQNLMNLTSSVCLEISANLCIWNLQ